MPNTISPRTREANRLLDQAHEEVEASGTLSEQTQRQLVVHFGNDQDGLAVRCIGWSIQKEKQPLLQTLEEEKARLERRIPEVVEQQRLEQQNELASMSLPSEEASKRILRYAANIERELRGSIQQLAWLQKERKKG